jgi:hypothetical protein
MDFVEYFDVNDVAAESGAEDKSHIHAQEASSDWHKCIISADYKWERRISH